MRANPIKWVIPGIITVLLGTAGAVQTTKASIEQDLATRAHQAFERAGLTWTAVSFDARDARLGGLTTSEQERERALQLLADLHGVRSVTQDVEMAPRVSPYPFRVSVADGKLHIEGGVPDEKVRATLLDQSGADTSDLKLLSGMPNREAWLAATDFALRQIDQFDRGEITLSDLSLSMHGRAKSQDAYKAIGVVLKAGLPGSIETGEVEIIPPLQVPYEWQAIFDGKGIDLNGYAPSDDAIDAMVASAPEGANVEPNLRLASGAPDTFAQTTSALLGAFAHVDQGEARIVDAAVSFTGAPASEAAVETLGATLTPLNATMELAPPRIDNFVLTADLTGGRTVFSGYVPDEDVRAELAARDSDSAGALRLGRGAPESFADSVAFGMAALDLLSEGRFAIENSALDITGNARDGDAYRALQDMLATGLPEGTELRVAQVEPFVAIPYLWAVERSAQGEYAFSGYVPAEQTQRYLTVKAGQVTSDTTEIAAGAPEDFITRAITAVETLARVDAGRASYSGAQWAFVARVDSTEQQDAVRAALGEGWQVDVEVVAPQQPASGTATPYTWRVAKEAGEPLVFSGHVPADGMKNFLSIRGGDGAAADIEIAEGAPEGFAQDVLAALEAVAALEAGGAGFDGVRWYVNGRTAEPDVDIAGRLAAAHTPASAWAIAVESPQPQPEDTQQPAEEADAAEVSEEAEQAEPAGDVTAGQSAEEAATEAETGDAGAAAVTEETEDATPAQSGSKRYHFSATKPEDAPIRLLGVVPAAPAASYLGVLAGDVPTDGLFVYEGAPEGFLPNAIAGVRALAALEQGELLHRNGAWSLSGTARTEADRRGVLAALSAPGWQTDIAIIPPTVLCREHLQAFAAENRILFAPASSRLTADSQEALDQLVVYLEECPGVPVHIEGHTDSDGPEDTNLALSVARAEAVVAALIQRGVDPARLYAVGYGESLPVAPNTTSDGKRRNRRIAFEIVEQAQ